MMKATRLGRILLLVGILAALGCGGTPPINPDATTESPGLKKTQIGQVYSLYSYKIVGSQNPPQIQGQSITLTISTPTRCLLSYACYTNGVPSGAVQYVIPMTWGNAQELTIGTGTVVRADCTPSFTLNFASNMRFLFSSNELEIYTPDLTQFAYFRLQSGTRPN